MFFLPSTVGSKRNKLTDLNEYVLLAIYQYLNVADLLAVKQVCRRLGTVANRQLATISRRTTAIIVQCAERRRMDGEMFTGFTPNLANGSGSMCGKAAHSCPLWIRCCPGKARLSRYIGSVRQLLDVISLDRIPLIEYLKIDVGQCSHRGTRSFRSIKIDNRELQTMTQDYLPHLEHLMINAYDVLSNKLLASPTCLAANNIIGGYSTRLERSVKYQLLTEIITNLAKRSDPVNIHLHANYYTAVTYGYTMLRHNVVKFSTCYPHELMPHGAYYMKMKNFHLRSLVISRCRALQYTLLDRILDGFPGLLHLSFSCSIQVILNLPESSFSSIEDFEWFEPSQPVRIYHNHYQDAEGIWQVPIEPNQVVNLPANVTQEYQQLSQALAVKNFKRMSLYFSQILTPGIFHHFSDLSDFKGLASLKLSTHVLGFSGANTAGLMWKLFIVRAFTTSTLKLLLIPLAHYNGMSTLEKSITWLLADLTFVWHSTIIPENTTLFDLRVVKPIVSKMAERKWNGIAPHSYRTCNGHHYLAIWSNKV
jgi:hypothetical protein